MFSISKNYNYRRLFVILFTLAIMMDAHAQVSQTVSVLPPYSNKLSDYIASPGKINSIITAQLPDYSKLEIYLRGTVMSADESIIIRTRTDYKPTTPIVISAIQTPAGAYIFQPYALTYSDILRIFDERHLEYRGITRQQVMQEGLPEGTYSICFDVIHYPSDTYFVSSCSNPFTVSSVEAPLIIQPLNNISLRGHETQSLLFSWTRPSNAPVSTQYKLKIIELGSPNENYQDKIRSAGYPVFFETSVSSNVYLYSAANPPLTEGKTYAFVVEAIDPAGKTAFRNKGFSEVNIFSYQPEQTVMSGTLPPGQLEPPGNIFSLSKPRYDIQANNIITPDMLSATSIKGKLAYKYKEGSEKYPLSNARIKLVKKYIVKSADGKFNEEMSYKTINEDQYVDGEEVAITETGSAGEFSFTFFSNYKIESLGETDCAPKGVASLNKTSGDTDDYLFADLAFGSGRGGPNPWNSEISNATENSASGKCGLYLAYAIQIEGEHARYYLNLDQDGTCFFEVNGGETKDVGEVVSLVKTINLNVTVKSEKKGAHVVTGENPELEGMDVYIYRKVNFDYPPVFPSDDVFPDKTDNFTAPKSNGMICVGKGRTNPKGIAKINALVLNDHPTYQYYIYINNDETYNFESKTPELIDFNTLLAPKPGGSGGNNIVDTSTPGFSIMKKEYSARNYFNINKVNDGYDITKELPANYPSLRIILSEGDGMKKVDGATVILKEEYKKDSYVQIMAVGYGEGKIDQDITRMVPLARVDTGKYQINDLGLEYDASNWKITGPKRTVTVKAPGFADTTFLVKGGAPLYMGQMFEMAVKLRYGAIFRGTVIDGETREPVPNAYIKILGETSASTTTDSDGKFIMEVRRLETPRKMEVSATGYMTDTTVIILNKPENVYSSCEIFRKERRLRVLVGKKGIVVTLPDVPSSSTGSYSSLLMGGLINSASSGSSTTTSARSKITATSPKPEIMTTGAKLAISSSQGFQISGLQALVTTPNETPPLSLVTDDDGQDGYVDFSFVHGSEDNNKFRVVISNSPTSTENYPTIIKEVYIPYSGHPLNTSFLQVDLQEGGCLSGTVYLGESDSKPLEGIDITATIYGQSEEYTVDTRTDASGKYTLRNLPVNLPFKLQVSTGMEGSNFVGYEKTDYMISQKGSVCQTEDFHMKTIQGADVSTFMGFPFNATVFKDLPGDTYSLSGKINIPDNNRFDKQIIDISDVKVKKSAVKNANGDALLVPVALPFVTDINKLNISIGSDYNAVITDDSGIKISLFDEQQLKGEIKANVLINGGNEASLGGNFGGLGYSLPDLYLAQSPGTKNTSMTVFSSGQIDFPTIGGNGFYLSDGKNETLTYSIDGFENKAIVQPDKSYFNKTNGLTLQTRLKAAIANLNPSNFEMDAGALNISKNGIKTVNQQPFDVKMGQWTLQCNKWSITNEGLKVTDATLMVGVDVQIENLKFTSHALETDKAIVHFEKLKLLGVKEVDITTSYKGLVYKYLHSGVSGWSLWASPEIGQTTVATLQGLPGVSPADKVEFISVDLNSEGESYFVLNSRGFRLFNIVDFTPYPSTYMYVTPTSLKLMGNYDFGIPEYERPSGAMGFFREGNNIAFQMMDMEYFAFTRNNVRYNLSKNYILSDQLFVAKGTVMEPGHLPELTVTLSHTVTNTKIDIDAGQKLPMGTGKELANLKGGTRVVNNDWDVLRFEGEVKGMNNMASGQKMNFEVKGAVMATGQQISVSDIPSFPGLSMTYDMPNARFIGSAPLNMNLSGLKLQGNVNTIMDSQGWLFNASGLIEIPGIGGANLYGLFGNYMNMPPEVSSKIGNAVCLPDGFKTNLRGFFLSAGLTKQILPKIHHDYGVVAVTAGVDVSVNARTFMMFGQGTTFGLGVLAEGHAYLGGSCGVTCTSVNADAKLQLGISGDYNTQSHVYNIDGCSSLSLKLSATQCVPVLVGCGPCASLTLADFTIGAKVHLDNVNGFSMGITTSSCDEQCK